MILAAMTTHAGHTDVQHQCCVVLGLFPFNSMNQSASVAAVGSPVVLAAMKAHTGDEGVQKKGCSALVNLACMLTMCKWLQPQGVFLWC